MFNAEKLYTEGKKFIAAARAPSDPKRTDIGTVETNRITEGTRASPYFGAHLLVLAILLLVAASVWAGVATVAASHYRAEAHSCHG